MTATVRVIVTRDEVEEYRREWSDVNVGLITDDEILDIMLENYCVDMHDFNTDYKIEILE